VNAGGVWLHPVVTVASHVDPLIIATVVPPVQASCGYLINSGVGGYLLLSGIDGANVLWNPRTGQTIRRFADVIAAGPEQIVWNQGCGTCRVQILNVTTGGRLTTPFPGNRPAALRASLSADGTLLAALLKGGALGVLDTATGTLTVIPGTAIRSPVNLTFAWLGQSYRLMVTATSSPSSIHAVGNNPIES